MGTFTQNLFLTLPYASSNVLSSMSLKTRCSCFISTFFIIFWRLWTDSAKELTREPICCVLSLFLKKKPKNKKQTKPKKTTYPKSPTRQQGKEFLRHASYILKKKRNNKHSLSKKTFKFWNSISLFFAVIQISVLLSLWKCQIIVQKIIIILRIQISHGTFKVLLCNREKS